MRNKMIYDIVSVNQKHNQLASWLPDGKAVFTRFEDGVDGQPAVTESSESSETTTEAATTISEATTVPDTQTTATERRAASDSLLDVAGLVNSDGTFVPDWHLSDKIPEDIRGSESLAVIKNLPDLAKRTVHAEKMVGKNKIAVPKADAAPEDIATFQEQVGKLIPSLARPETANEYKFDVPEGMEQIYTDEKMSATRELAHKIGVTQSQYEAFMQADAEMAKAEMDSAQIEADRLHDEAVLALKKEWGEAYPERQHVVKRLIAEAFGANKTGEMAFLEQFGGNPEFVRFAANIGSKMVESKALVAELTNSTPTESLKRIEELKATPGYLSMGSDMTPAQRAEITAQIRSEYQTAYPERK